MYKLNSSVMQNQEKQPAVHCHPALYLQTTCFVLFLMIFLSYLIINSVYRSLLCSREQDSLKYYSGILIVQTMAHFPWICFQSVKHCSFIPNFSNPQFFKTPNIWNQFLQRTTQTQKVEPPSVTQ